MVDPDLQSGIITDVVVRHHFIEYVSPFPNVDANILLHLRADKLEIYGNLCERNKTRTIIDSLLSITFGIKAPSVLTNRAQKASLRPPRAMEHS